MRGLCLVLLTTGLLPVQNCINRINGPIACTALYAYGVSSTVTSAQNGAKIDNATLTLRDGEYVEVMQHIFDGEYVGAGERAGTYTLTAVAPGFQPQVVENIVVTADECHVKGVRVDVQLDPAP